MTNHRDQSTPRDEWEIVDTHVHLFDLTDPLLAYTWLDPANPHGILSPDEVARLASPVTYRASDFLADAASGGVFHGVHVQAAVGIDDPVRETEWLEAQRVTTGFPDAIVGHVDLASRDAEATMDRHLAASQVFVGVRDFGNGDYLADKDWLAGLAALGSRGLVASLDLTWERMDAAAIAAGANENTLIVVDHMGMPLARDQEYFAQWSGAMRRLARASNVVCKISELCMVPHSWDETAAMPWMEACLDAFGVDRCFVGSNWPVESLYMSYSDLADAYRHLVLPYSHDERRAILSGNARRVYSLGG
jgi:predicted TIM-barrel fold metal-dependent hydrolase